ncbi:MAG: PRC-barrel domain-containing protein [Burkholderiales bacterium]|nr:PRC-barrel domain-containing protein [Burkholderiales bacterium]
MLRSMKDLQGYAIGAIDGSLGQVKDFYFDDRAWVIRYLVVETGSWLASRKVLISPISIHEPSWDARVLPVAITREQVRNSPDIDTALPVSRQHELQYFGHYGYPTYWGGSGLWGMGLYPYGLLPGYAGYGADTSAREQALAAADDRQQARDRDDDPHLRSCQAVIGYRLHATDGEIGHVESLLVDEDTWAIRYVVVNTSNWWLGHQVLVAPQHVTALDWAGESATVDLGREAIRSAPAYDSTRALNREGEPAAPHRHDERTDYWVNDPAEGPKR